MNAQSAAQTNSRRRSGPANALTHGFPPDDVQEQMTCNKDSRYQFAMQVSSDTLPDPPFRGQAASAVVARGLRRVADFLEAQRHRLHQGHGSHRILREEG